MSCETTGAILSGLIAAGGSVASVYFMLSSQRKGERKSIRSALIREVIEFSRMIVGKLETCQHIYDEVIILPISRLPEVFQFPKPIIYPAVADRIGLLESPQRVVAFYTRLFEIETMARAIANGPIPATMLNKFHIKLIVEACLDVCQLADNIIQDTKVEKDFDKVVAQNILNDMTAATKLAREMFQISN